MRIGHYWPMKSAFLRPDEGFEILINGVLRTFRDVEAVAYEAARYAKQRNRGEVVELRICATGAKVLMLEDGRTG